MKYTLRTSVLLTLAAVLLMSLTAIKWPDVSDNIYVQKASVVQVIKRDSGGLRRGSCTGWVLAGTSQIVTAAHCLGQPAPADESSPYGVRKWAADPDKPSLYVIFNEDGIEHLVTVAAKGDAELVNGPDLMILTMVETSYKMPQGLKVCSFEPRYGQNVYVMGHALGGVFAITRGYVSRPKEWFVPLGDSPYVRDFIRFDGRMYPGNSGGPVVDETDGCVVGVVEMGASFTLEGYDDMNWLTPIKHLKIILAGLK